MQKTLVNIISLGSQIVKVLSLASVHVSMVAADSAAVLFELDAR